MALVNLKTQYTSLKFGNDQRGGGDSGLPYVKFDTNGNASTTSGFISVAGTVQSDFPIRGGTYPSNQIDLARIKSFLAGSKGKIFVDKQQTLQFMNPKTETGPSFVDSDKTSRLPGLVENTRVFNPENLLGQVKVEGTGGHLSRFGVPRFGVNDEFYAETVGIQNVTNNAVNNRLLLLTRLKIASSRTHISTSNLGSILSAGDDYLLAKKFGISTNSLMLFNYPGGPNSSYGVGSTVIRRAVDTTTLNPIPGVMNYQQIADFNFTKGDTYSDMNLDSMENRIGTYTTSAKKEHNTSDLINKLYQQTITDKTNDPFTIIAKQLGLAKTDSIKFGFECMDNDNPGDYTMLMFRALLTNGFTDNNSAVLNSFRYFGRGEEFHTYQGFTRQISFSFKIAAFSKDELQPLYNKLNYLISQVYPDYAPSTSIMRAPLIKLTIGDYLYRVPGFLESVNVTVDNTSPWEINLDNDPNLQELPHVLEVAISFKPILSILPKRSTPSSGNTNLITNGTKQGFLQFETTTSDIAPVTSNNT